MSLQPHSFLQAHSLMSFLLLLRKKNKDQCFCCCIYLGDKKHQKRISWLLLQLLLPGDPPRRFRQMLLLLLNDFENPSSELTQLVKCFSGLCTSQLHATWTILRRKEPNQMKAYIIRHFCFTRNKNKNTSKKQDHRYKNNVIAPRNFSHMLPLKLEVTYAVVMAKTQ